jgi:hypothetical protein
MLKGSVEMSMTLEELLVLRKDGNTLQKAKRFDEVVDYLMDRVFEARRNVDSIMDATAKERLDRFAHLEKALAMCGYTRGATG